MHVNQIPSDEGRPTADNERNGLNLEFLLLGELPTKATGPTHPLQESSERELEKKEVGNKKTFTATYTAVWCYAIPIGWVQTHRSVCMYCVHIPQPISVKSRSFPGAGASKPYMMKRETLVCMVCQTKPDFGFARQAA